MSQSLASFNATYTKTTSEVLVFHDIGGHTVRDGIITHTYGKSDNRYSYYTSILLSLAHLGIPPTAEYACAQTGDIFHHDQPTLTIQYGNHSTNARKHFPAME